MVAKVDDELKKLSVSYNEKIQAMSALSRKRNINLITSDFEDFLTPEKVARFEFLNTEYLQTLIVVLNSQNEAGIYKLFIAMMYIYFYISIKN